MRDDLPAWRSLLFVPVTAEKFVRTGADRGADGIILDLEDASRRRKRTRPHDDRGCDPQVSRNGGDVLVRVNRPWRLLVRDLEAAVIPGIAALMLTKVDSPEHVHAVAEIVEELEAERGLTAGKIQFVVLVETAAGFFRIEAIAKSHPRIVALSLGTEDFTADVGMLPDRKACCIPSSTRCSPRARPASCRWASSARSPTSATRRHSAPSCAARSGSASSAPARSIRCRCRC